jgi:S1-C subfamily serine protease
MVVSLDPNGPARTAGLHVGDIIVGVDGQAVVGLRSLRSHLMPESVGRSAEVRVVRAGQIATHNVTIAASPSP